MLVRISLAKSETGARDADGIEPIEEREGKFCKDDGSGTLAGAGEDFSSPLDSFFEDADSLRGSGAEDDSDSLSSGAGSSFLVSGFDSGSGLESGLESGFDSGLLSATGAGSEDACIDSGCGSTVAAGAVMAAAMEAAVLEFAGSAVGMMS